MKPFSGLSARWTGLLLAFVIFIVDQVSKFYVQLELKLNHVGQIELLPILRFTWVQNFGVSLGMLTASGDLQRWLLVGATAAIAVVVLVWMWREQRRGDIYCLAMIFGGALGNICDRARVGYVIDFIDLHFGDFRPFLVFNVADAAISIGVAILLLRALFLRERSAEDKAKEANRDA